MTEHRLAVVGMRYPGFGSVPALKDSTVEAVAKAIHAAGADIVATTETGRRECARLAEAFGSTWTYHRAQGTSSGEGINGLFWDERALFNQDDRLWDWNLRAHGQWPGRTFLLVRLAENDDPTAFVQAGSAHLAATGSPLSRQGANAAKWDQIHQVREMIGGKRVLVGMDFPRTDDDDDTAWLRKQGLTLHGRTDKTPMVGLSQGAVRVSSTRLLAQPSGLDHQPNLITFTVPGKADA